MYANKINATLLHQKKILGQGVVIAVIDTGCQLNHKLLKNKIIGGKNFTTEGHEDDYSDRNGHGTHIAGIIAGDYNEHYISIAPECKLLILKAMDSYGCGTIETITAAIEYAIDQGVDIINMSIGCPYPDERLYNAVKKAISNNIPIVCASGNSGDGLSHTDEFDYPAGYEEVICVGAIGNDYKVKKFSNSNKFVDLVAPGEDITSTYIYNQLATLSGSSMAAPIVSGALALLIQYSTKEFGRKLNEKELYGLLLKSTKTLNCKRTLQGHGFLYLDVFNVFEQ